MKCNWCGEGSGRNYTKNKEGDIYWYYCVKCLGKIDRELEGDEE